MPLEETDNPSILKNAFFLAKDRIIYFHINSSKVGNSKCSENTSLKTIIKEIWFIIDYLNEYVIWNLHITGALMGRIKSLWDRKLVGKSTLLIRGDLIKFPFRKVHPVLLPTPLSLQGETFKYWIFPVLKSTSHSNRNHNPNHSFSRSDSSLEANSHCHKLEPQLS